MPIEASSIVPVKKILERSDGSKDTWVMIVPISYRHDMMRGEFLKDGRMVADAISGIAKAVSVNPYGLRAEELWITYHNAHIVIKAKNEDGVEETVEPFRPRDEMTRTEFMIALGSLPPHVVLEWYRMMLEVNPGWQFPF